MWNVTFVWILLAHCRCEFHSIVKEQNVHDTHAHTHTHLQCVVLSRLRVCHHMPCHCRSDNGLLFARFLTDKLWFSIFTFYIVDTQHALSTQRCECPLSQLTPDTVSADSRFTRIIILLAIYNQVASMYWLHRDWIGRESINTTTHTPRIPYNSFMKKFFLFAAHFFLLYVPTSFVCTFAQQRVKLSIGKFLLLPQLFSEWLNKTKFFRNKHCIQFLF